MKVFLNFLVKSYESNGDMVTTKIRTLVAFLAAIALLAALAFGFYIIAGKLDKRFNGGLDTLPPEVLQVSSQVVGDEWIKEVALRFNSTAENGTMNWESKYSFIKDIGDGAGYTAGIIGFNVSSGSLLEVLMLADKKEPNNPLSQYISKLEQISEAPYSERASLSNEMLGTTFVDRWRQSSESAWLKEAQNEMRDERFYDYALKASIRDEVKGLGTVIYYDTMIQHGVTGGEKIITEAKGKGIDPSAGGSPEVFLKNLLETRNDTLKSYKLGASDGRVQALSEILERNSILNAPIEWRIYGKGYILDRITPQPQP